MKKRGILITFEGGEGSGKSTQIREVAKFLKKNGFQIELYREPGSTQAGEEIRKILLNPDLKKMAWQAELLLFLAARAQLVREKIAPAIQKGKAVLVDRYEDSTIAYQSFGRGLDLKKVAAFFPFVRENYLPDLTFFLDVPVSLGMQRAAKRGKADRMEKSKRIFHERVRKGFLTLARKNPGRIHKIYSGRAVEEVREDIFKVLDVLIKKRK